MNYEEVDMTVFGIPSIFSSVSWFSFQINLGIYIKDKSTELSVLVDRSVGGASINDGEVEIMLHRFFFYFYPLH